MEAADGGIFRGDILTSILVLPSLTPSTCSEWGYLQWRASSTHGDSLHEDSEKSLNLQRVSRDRSLSTADPYPLHMEGNGREWEENEVACWLNRTRNFKNTHLGIRANELNGIFYRVSMHRFPCACSPAQRPLSTCFLVANRREKKHNSIPQGSLLQFVS